MSDFLLELGQNPAARKLIKTLNLPIPIPQALRRGRGPWEERPLFDQAIAVSAPERSALTPFIARALARAGADPLVSGGEDAARAFREPGEAWGRPPRALDPAALAADPTLRIHGAVFDA